ncbi:TetR/AcrR family transcriptional regulator C-terminal domain-containing protein [Streptomyces sp. NPDC056544]|uniref:TetR/AcrR family transcriptional regulator C-terminal domain-containing protein n=1 Tax=unclassified Streptomyces TaxID=2593676 RepID=UPI0036931052
MLDAVAAEDGGPPAPTGDWRDDLRDLAHRSRAAFHRHPWMTSLAAGRPSLGPNSLDAIEHALCSSDGIHGTRWARSLRGMRTSGPSRIALLEEGASPVRLPGRAGRPWPPAGDS